LCEFSPSYRTVVDFGHLLENYKSSAIFWAAFFMVQYALFLAKMGWATFWAIFSQSHRPGGVL
jgi:hypothetical protein